MSALSKLGLDHTDFKCPNLVSESQDQTKSSFGFQWSKRKTYESDAVSDFGKGWLIERYCDNNPNVIDKWLSGGPKIILDAGCGAAYSALLLFGEKLNSHNYLGIDISSAVDQAEKRFIEKKIAGDFCQSSITDLPFKDESLDIIFSEGVLHHTDNTEKAFKYLANFLKVGGRFLFYLYAKKSVIREFTDDHIRSSLSSLNDESAWDALYPLTELGVELGKLNIKINVPADIDYLGIKKGEMDLQRFFYWNICKAFYQPDFSLDEMNHMNFDWFRPLNCYRHTPEEIKKWCKDTHMKIEQINVQEAGITVVAQKTAGQTVDG